MISVQDIKKLAVLARIKLVEEEEQKLAQDMEHILGYVKHIQEASGALEPQKEKVRNVLRVDSNPHESGLFTEDILDGAPQRDGQYIKVKKIL